MKSRALILSICGLAVLLGGLGGLVYERASAPAARPGQPPLAPTPAPAASTPAAADTAPGAPAAQARPPFFAHYYLWWDSQHWRAKLGPAYPYTQTPPPLPAELAADGCAATSAYANNQLLDIPAALGLYSQDSPEVLQQHIQDAASAGLTGFVVSWSGDGKPHQTTASGQFSGRLDGLVQAVNRYNASHATKFYLMLGYQGLNNARDARPIDWVQNDLAYFMTTYKDNAAFQIPYYHAKPVIMLLDSRKFAVEHIATIASAFGSERDHILFIGDEHGVKEWNRGVNTYFDGDGWYWSSQNPYTNKSSFQAVANLSSLLKQQQKLWFSPLNGGYNKSNFAINGSCIPRNAGETLKDIYAGNKASNPDGWMFISWNEFYENTYIEPSLRYGRTYLDVLKNIIAAS